MSKVRIIKRQRTSAALKGVIKRNKTLKKMADRKAKKRQTMHLNQKHQL